MDLRDVLSQLDPDHRRAVTLVYSEHRSIGEAALVLAVEPAAVTGWLTQAFVSVARWAVEDDTGDDHGTGVGWRRPRTPPSRRAEAPTG